MPVPLYLYPRRACLGAVLLSACLTATAAVSEVERLQAQQECISRNVRTLERVKSESARSVAESVVHVCREHFAGNDYQLRTDLNDKQREFLRLIWEHERDRVIQDLQAAVIRKRAVLD